MVDDNRILEEEVLNKLKQMYPKGHIAEMLGISSNTLNRIISKLKKENRWNSEIQIEIKTKVRNLIMDGYTSEEISQKLNIDIDFVEKFQKQLEKNGTLHKEEKALNFNNALEMVKNGKELSEILKICNGLNKTEILNIKINMIEYLCERCYTLDEICKKVDLSRTVVTRYLEQFKSERENDVTIDEKVPSLKKNKSNHSTQNHEMDEYIDSDEEIQEEENRIVEKTNKTDQEATIILNKIKQCKADNEDLIKLKKLVKYSFMSDETFKKIIKTLIKYKMLEEIIPLINIKDEMDDFNEEDSKKFKELKKQIQEEINLKEALRLLKEGNLFPSEIAERTNNYETTIIRLAREHGIPLKKQQLPEYLAKDLQ